MIRPWCLNEVAAPNMPHGCPIRTAGNKTFSAFGDHKGIVSREKLLNWGDGLDYLWGKKTSSPKKETTSYDIALAHTI